MPNEPFQFHIRTLLVLTTICAVVLGWASMGHGARHLRFGVAIYFLVLVGYAVIRLPHFYRALTGRSRAWKEIRARRRELEEEAKRLREERRSMGGRG